MHNKNNIT